MGHSEPASGLCSVAKVLIAMETGVIPPNLHFQNPNPDIPALSDGRLQASCVKCVTGWKFEESSYTLRFWQQFGDSDLLLPKHAIGCCPEIDQTP
jgi:hypothetical protein